MADREPLEAAWTAFAKATGHIGPTMREQRGVSAAIAAFLRSAADHPETVETLAMAIHDDDDTTATAWPDGTGDDGHRGDGGYVRLCLHTETYRDAARAAVKALIPASEHGGGE